MWLKPGTRIALLAAERNGQRLLARLFALNTANLAAVVMLHRIDEHEPARMTPNENLKISPSCLEDFILQAKNSGYRFGSLDDLALAIASPQRAVRLLVLTVDDGWRDNLVHGLPIFRRHQVPFCIYVATGMVSQEFIYWWYLVEDLILANAQIRLSNGRVFDCSTRTRKERAFLAIRDCVMRLSQQELDFQLRNLFADYSVDWNAYRQDLALTWEHVRELAKEPLATIGCHTHSHRSFRGCSEQDIIADIARSRTLMRTHAGLEMKHFCFPFGGRSAISGQHIDLIRSLQFDTATTTRRGFVSKRTDPLQIPRIMVNDHTAAETLRDFRLFLPGNSSCDAVRSC